MKKESETLEEVLRLNSKLTAGKSCITSSLSVVQNGAFQQQTFRLLVGDLSITNQIVSLWTSKNKNVYSDNEDLEEKMATSKKIAQELTEKNIKLAKQLENTYKSKTEIVQNYEM